MNEFLQHDKMQLKVNQLFSRKPKVKFVVKDDKGKVVINFNQLEDKDVYMNPRRPKTIGLSRQKEQESEPFSPLGQHDFDDMIAAEIEQEKYFWLSRVNE